MLHTSYQQFGRWLVVSHGVLATLRLRCVVFFFHFLMHIHPSANGRWLGSSHAIFLMSCLLIAQDTVRTTIPMNRPGQKRDDHQGGRACMAEIQVAAVALEVQLVQTPSHPRQHLGSQTRKGSFRCVQYCERGFREMRSFQRFCCVCFAVDVSCHASKMLICIIAVPVFVTP